jgi:deazaflavin-dependent oxidoreductase (nitroreductase family)
MSIQKLPGGTRGGRTPPHFMNRIATPLMVRIHRRAGDRLRGLDLLYLTTVGAKSGQPRTNGVARFDDGRGGWIIVASAGGATQQPGWYHNVVAHPDDVWAEVSRTRHKVRVEQLEGEARDEAWSRVVGRAPAFESYLTKTDRTLPVLRLTPEDTVSGEETTS